MKPGYLVLIGLVGLLVPAVQAERRPEAKTVPLLTHRPPLVLPATTQTAPDARVRITFWVGLDGDVEAVEQECGERPLFDEIVDHILNWKFKEKNFITEISFVRRGKRVALLMDLPPSRRPKYFCGVDGK